MPQINFDLTANNEDKVLSKRCPTSAVMQLQMELPGGNVLEDGTHTVGFIEGNVSITKVALVTKVAFDGPLPSVTVTDTQNGVTEDWLTGSDISVQGEVEESTLTAPDDIAGKQAPFYRATKSEWKATVDTDGSTVGELALLIDYVQMDAEPGKHS